MLNTPTIEARLELLERDYYELGDMDRVRYLRRREALLRKLAEAQAAAEDAGIDLPAELARNLSEPYCRAKTSVLVLEKGPRDLESDALTLVAGAARQSGANAGDQAGASEKETGQRGGPPRSRPTTSAT